MSGVKRKALFEQPDLESSDFITLKDKEPLLVKKILEYLYTGDYTIDGPTADTNSASQVLDNPTVTTLSKTRDANADLSSRSALYYRSFLAVNFNEL
ncbi:hypothetical protein N7462_008645 [Penicillium macrosclerotiorum]|uniref:uncharacterized protein n=1 Tax=Penicillium macrosclerotiorum TaxID=303699 RepID=UPI00254743B0|nr:uncharacterized protein N7462_008645 [Penicillium macrosclerotiorum]KAJ5675748.1 hypothetical protein N7462_008645 [Penicillium macrosclerotiorum]